MRRELVCHSLAALFCFTVVVPTVMVFGDRSYPFETSHVFFRPAEARPGSIIMLSYTLTGIEKRCEGRVQQTIIDADGNVWDLGVIPALYASRVDEDRTRTLYRPKMIPALASPGPAVYRAKVEYWCNPLQQLYPIRARTLEVPFTVK